MNTVLFATSNQEKLLIAKTVGAKFNLQIKQAVINIDEIQGEDPALIIKDKAKRAYQCLSKSVVVSDDLWSIPALNGFPGPYMKSINKWFKAEDLIRLMDGVKNRTIILQQYLAYYDGSNMKIFSNNIFGKIIDEPRGHNENSPCMSVIILNDDNGKTIAQVFENDKRLKINRYENRPDVWHKFINWYVTYLKTKNIKIIYD